VARRATAAAQETLKDTKMAIRGTRRDVVALAGAALVAPPVLAQTVAALITRAIPSSGERLPAVGLGTAVVFDTNDEATRQKAAAVLQAMIANGGCLVDTASSYGDAESVLIAPAGLRDNLFIATKVEALNATEIKRSLARLKTARVDLLQLHNVRDPHQSLARFKDWKAQGLCRYIGITSTFHGDFTAVEAVLQREKPDCLQIDYSLSDREVEKRILPLASEVNSGVADGPPLRPRSAVWHRAQSGVRRQLGAILPQISTG
jgi:aryl-alcohol dehydrogenase-like predicted oxidoreductase